MKRTIIASAVVLIGTAAYAQSAIDAYRLSQPDLKGTARYMSMGGAFGALGGDLSVLSHNPGGIGVFRNSDVGFTVDLDLQSSTSNAGTGYETSIDQTKFLLNNLGFVWTLKLSSASCPNINVGFTYNKNTSFNRRYRGSMPLSTSLSNYVAGVTTVGGYSEDMLLGDDYNNPYDPSSGVGAPWLSILGYDGYMFSQNGTTLSGSPNYVGQWDSGTSGTGYFDVQESGGVDSYNIAIGGNISNLVFWGMDFDITHLNYNLTPMWSENLQGALVENNFGQLSRVPSQWTLSNFYNCRGTGFNYKLGFIVKPIQEFRIGFAFETPTWYGLTETFSADYDALYNRDRQVFTTTNDDIPGYNNVDFRTPWKLNASAAVVLINKLIISAEYEWTQYKGMKFSTPSPWGGDYWDDNYYPWDPWYPWYAKGKAGGFDPYVANPGNYYYTNQDIQDTYCNTNTLRLGAEFRVLPQLSLRAGYSYVSSPVESGMNNEPVTTAGTIPNYRFDNTTNYVTAGLGFRVSNFYVDLAYVYKNMKSEYHAFSSLMNEDYKLNIPGQKSHLSLNNSQVVLSAGFKF